MKLKLKFKKIAICASQKNNQIDEIAKQCCEVLKSLDVIVYVNDNLSSVVNSTKSKVVNDKTLKQADLMVVIGGDGSILGFARRFGSLGIPLLGINLGNLGFLADIAPENLTSILTDIAYGKFKKDKRFFLEASINSEKRPYIALNEIVIHSGKVAQLIEYEVFIDEVFVYRQRADGLIINSPTGSTAYSLSGGGPIIHPDVKAITLLPMFPHSLSTSPLLVKDTSNIEIVMIGSKNKATLSMDSHNSLSLKKGDSILIQKTSYDLTLIHPRDHNFFSACRNKLGWSSAIT
jgi:NAD+ kinase